MVPHALGKEDQLSWWIIKVKPERGYNKAVIALGKSMQLKVVAEGVETQEQKSFLDSEGCDEVQGYYYSRPVPEKDFVELLKSPK